MEDIAYVAFLHEERPRFVRDTSFFGGFCRLACGFGMDDREVCGMGNHGRGDPKVAYICGCVHIFACFLAYSYTCRLPVKRRI